MGILLKHFLEINATFFASTFSENTLEVLLYIRNSHSLPEDVKICCAAKLLHDGNSSLDEEAGVNTLFICLSVTVFDTDVPTTAKPPSLQVYLSSEYCCDVGKCCCPS